MPKRFVVVLAALTRFLRCQLSTALARPLEEALLGIVQRGHTASSSPVVTALRTGLLGARRELGDVDRHLTPLPIGLGKNKREPVKGDS